LRSVSDDCKKRKEETISLAQDTVAGLRRTKGGKGEGAKKGGGEKEGPRSPNSNVSTTEKKREGGSSKKGRTNLIEHPASNDKISRGKEKEKKKKTGEHSCFNTVVPQNQKKGRGEPF